MTGAHEKSPEEVVRDLPLLDSINRRRITAPPRDLGLDLDTRNLKRRPLAEEDRARIREAWNRRKGR